MSKKKKYRFEYVYQSSWQGYYCNMLKMYPKRSCFLKPRQNSEERDGLKLSVAAHSVLCQ